MEMRTSPERLEEVKREIRKELKMDSFSYFKRDLRRAKGADVVVGGGAEMLFARITKAEALRIGASLDEDFEEGWWYLQDGFVSLDPYGCTRKEVD